MRGKTANDLIRELILDEVPSWKVIKEEQESAK